MNSTDSQDQSPQDEQSHLTEDGLSPPESFWIKQEAEQPAAEAAMQEAANQKVLDRQLEQLEEAKAFATRTLGETENRAHAEQALAIWYVKKYGEKLRPSHTAQIVRDAALALRPKSEGLREGDEIDATEAKWLWEGMVMQGQFNLIVGAPKVGKSALITAMIGALARGDRELLGRPLAEECPPVILIGVDQPYSMWAQLLNREDLLQDQKLQWPVKRLMAAGDGLALDEDGLDRIQQMAEEHPGALIVLDSYDALVSPLGNEEASALFARPARLLIDRLAPTGATWVVLHHTNKSVSGGSAISASRGSNALPAAASWCLLLNWLKQVAPGATQTDFRVMVSGQGRARGSVMLCQLTGEGSECHWESLGDATQVMEADRLADAENNINDGRKADVLDYVRERYELGNFAVTASEVASALNLRCTRADARVKKSLEQLTKEGLVVVHRGAIKPGPAGGRASDAYWYWMANREKVALPTKEGVLGVIGVKPRAHVLNKEFDPFDSYKKDPNDPHDPLESENDPYAGEGGSNGFDPLPGQAVEILMSDGSWQNSWIVTEGSTEHAVRVEKLGQPALTRSKLRWLEDVKPCTGSPFAAPPTQPEPGEPGYDPNAPF
jgi:hypothetical protein